jgi:ornithine decarboxylase
MYAVKCNPHPYILDTLHRKGVGFDVASAEELRQAVRVGSRSMILANPCKSKEDILVALHHGVQHMTFDSVPELVKLLSLFPDAKPVLRIHVDDKGGSRIPLNTKFGFPLSRLDTLLQLNLPMYGLAFHVGSDCTSADSYRSAFATVRSFCDTLLRTSWFVPEILDIGGGFSGHPERDTLFQTQLAPVIQEQLSYFPMFERCIAEPGRFFAENACSATVNVIGRKQLPDGRTSITVDESLYGLFSGIAFDGQCPSFEHPSTTRRIPYVVFGRTCDSADKIADSVLLPEDLELGDPLTIERIGAYSYSSASTFNGFPKPDVHMDV